MNINLVKASKLVKSGKYEKAEKIIKLERKRDPKNIKLMNFLAGIYMSTERHRLAEELMTEIHKRKEVKATSFYINYASTLRKLKKYNDAIKIVNEGLSKTPDSLELIIEKASSLRKIDCIVNARELLNSALSLEPNSRAWTVLGNLEYELRNFEASRLCFETTIEKNHITQSAIVGLIRSYFALEMFGEVVASYLKFNEQLTYKQNIELYNCAMASVAHVNRDSYKLSLAKLLRLRKGFTEELVDFHSKLISPIFFRSSSEIRTFRENYLDLLKSCKVGEINGNIENFKPKSHLYLAYHGENNLEINTALADLVPHKELKNFSQYNSRKHTDAKIKIVVVTEYFYPEHVIYRLFNEIFARLAADCFDVKIFNIKKESELNLSTGEVSVKSLSNGSERTFKYYNLKMLVKELAKAAPDTLFFPEVGEGAVTYAIANHRIAKAQVTSWGFPQSTGLPTIDYFISSKSMEPENCSEHYSERLIQFNHLPCFYERAVNHKSAEMPKEIEESLNGSRYISCLQSLFKIHPDFDKVIMQILHDNPDVKLVMLDLFGKTIISERFEKTGIKVDEQIVFLPKMEREVFLSVLSGSIAALNPLYFGSGNTMYEAFSLGLPLVTMPGPFMRGRAVYGAYQQMGLTDLVADSAEQYVEKVNRLIHNNEFRALTEQKINDNSHSLFSTSEVIEEFKELFLKITN